MLELHEIQNCKRNKIKRNSKSKMKILFKTFVKIIPSFILMLIKSIQNYTFMYIINKHKKIIRPLFKNNIANTSVLV